jgi:signal transduction histidine kinase
MVKLLSSITHSIRGRLIAGVLLLHALLMGLVVFDMMSRQQDFMEHQLASKGMALSQALAVNATSWMISNDLTGLDELTDGLKRDPELVLSMIIDIHAKVRASSDDKLFNLTLDDPQTLSLIDKQKRAGRLESVYSWHDGIVDCLSPIMVGNTPIGYSRAVLSADLVSAELNQVLQKGSLYTLAAIIAGGFLAWFLVHSMTGRLASLSRAADAVAAGDLSVTLPQGKADQDEVGRLICDFNGMLEAIKQDRSSREALMQRIDAANDDLTRLTEVSAHHLQEPVRRLITYSQILRGQIQQNVSPEEVEKTLTQIDQDGRYLRSLIADIRAYLAAVHAEPVNIPANAKAAVENACRSLREKIRETKAEVMIGDLPEAVIAPDQLAQLFSQAIDNSLKFSSPGVVPRISIDGECQNNTVRFRISDNGIGVPPDLRERVFRIFERLHQQSRYSGTGIGLAIVRRIAENCGGKVWLEDSPLGGAAIVVQLQSVGARAV